MAARPDPAAALEGGPGTWPPKAAVALVVPFTAWPPIQRVRARHDKGFCRWPPHINLLYPFHEDRGGCFEAAAAHAAQALAHLPAFEVTFERLQMFDHGRTCTVWLEPSGPEMRELQAALVQAFPECTDLSEDAARGITRFTPHLSLGQWRSPAAAQAAIAELTAAWQPLRLRVAEVALLAREGFDDPFTVRYTVPLGGGGPAQRLDVPCIATMGAAGAEQAPLPCGPADRGRYGIGALPAIWNFAYGANINPRKLSATRGLTPLVSKPALLTGFRLAFNHRGGFGNLIPLAPGEAAPPGGGVHGVLHAFSPADMAKLMCMEHEYLPTEVFARPYDGSGPEVAVAFITPPERAIAEGLPPISRYLDLIVDGAEEWELDGSYIDWLRSTPSIDAAHKRSDAHYSSPDGAQLPAWPKIRTGSTERGGRGRQGRRGGRGRGEGSSTQQ